MANTKELVLERISNGCIIPTSHKLNHDGYFRKRVWVDGQLKSMMYHRYIWLESGKTIPEGYEIDHKCKNRACCNIEHLQCLSSTIHRTKDNTGRNSARKELAQKHWLETRCTGKELSDRYGVSSSAACKWIKSWKQ